MSEVTTASSLQVDYITLLTTQLQNQNPLDPMDNSDMTSQLAQFSELSQLESMNSSFSEVLARTEQNYASTLLGKEVSFVGDVGDGEAGLITGSVDQIVNSDGEIYLGVGDYSLTLDDILGINNIVEETSDTTDTTDETE